MAEPFIGEIREVAFDFAPPGWLPCKGQLLAISENEALYNLVGTTYGGDGQTTFGIPDLQGRAPIHAGQLNGGHAYTLGQKLGAENVTLTSAQMAAHTHLVGASSQLADLPTPTANSTWGQLTQDGNTPAYGFSPAPGNVSLAPSTVSTAGGNQPISVQQPYLAVTYMIATVGIYPTQS